MNQNGTWIFLSHSSKDIEKVRFIRNEFEKLGHKPLMFFLKCIDDNSELEDLIKREIEARNWFVLCDSDNAKKSKWVQEEISMIKKFENKFFKTISLDEKIDKQINQIHNFSKRVTIFISYNSKIEKTKNIVNQIYKKLKEEDYSVFLDTKDLEIGEIFQETINNFIKKASQRGFFLLIIDNSTFKNKVLLKELEEAIKEKSNIIPIFIENINSIKNIPEHILNLKSFDFSKGDINQNIISLIKDLKTRKIY